MKLASLLENDVYNSNPKLRELIEKSIPKLHQSIVLKIREDKYEEAAALLEQLKMAAHNCSIQLKSFKSNDGLDKGISNTEL